MPSGTLLFPPTLDMNSPPPVQHTIHENQITPKYYLGWVLPQHETMKLFGDGPRNGDTVVYYIHNNLCKRWLLVDPSVSQQNPKNFLSPKCLRWKPLHESSPLHEPLPPYPLSKKYVVVYLTSNRYPDEMKFFEDHREEVIRISLEVTRLSPEKREELKWHRVK